MLLLEHSVPTEVMRIVDREARLVQARFAEIDLEEADYQERLEDLEDRRRLDWEEIEYRD